MARCKLRNQPVGLVDGDDAEILEHSGVVRRMASRLARGCGLAREPATEPTVAGILAPSAGSRSVDHRDAAAFVFFAGAAGAQVVPANLDLGAARFRCAGGHGRMLMLAEIPIRDY